MSLWVSLPLFLILSMACGYGGFKLAALLLQRWAWPAWAAYALAGGGFLALVSVFLTLILGPVLGGGLNPARNVLMAMAFLAFTLAAGYLVRPLILGMQPRLPSRTAAVLLGGLAFLGFEALLAWLLLPGWLLGNATSPQLPASPLASDTPSPTNTLTMTPRPSATSTATPLPTATFTPTPFSRSNVDCRSGDPIPSSYPAEIQLQGAGLQVATGDDACFYTFGFEFMAPIPSSSELFGEVQIYDPTTSLLSEPDSSWFFNNSGNHGLGFYWAGGVLDIYFAYVTADGSAWQTTTIPGMSGQVDGNHLILRVPCGAFANFSDRSTWFATVSRSPFSICQEFGMDTQTGLPAIPLPRPPGEG